MQYTNLVVQGATAYPITRKTSQTANQAVLDASSDPVPGQESGTDSLPCLNSNISTEISAETTKSDPSKSYPILSTQHRKTAFILKESVQKLSVEYGLKHLGLLTLTFREHITSPKEAQRRLNSLITHVIKTRYFQYLGVFERQKSGRIHYHLLVVVKSDIRTGVNFEEIANQKYSSAPKALREEWAFLRRTAPKYGFGRTELLPVRSNTEAIAKYVGKYIGKHIDQREDQDKGVRLVRYSKGSKIGNTRFQFHSAGSAHWRRKLAIFAEIVQTRHPEKKINSISDLTETLGPRWAYTNRDFILNLP